LVRQAKPRHSGAAAWRSSAACACGAPCAAAACSGEAAVASARSSVGGGARAVLPLQQGASAARDAARSAARAARILTHAAAAPPPIHAHGPCAAHNTRRKVGVRVPSTAIDATSPCRCRARGAAKTAAAVRRARAAPRGLAEHARRVLARGSCVRACVMVVAFVPTPSPLFPYSYSSPIPLFITYSYSHIPLFIPYSFPHSFPYSSPIPIPLFLFSQNRNFVFDRPAFSKRPPNGGKSRAILGRSLKV
jgi:hypothetical protein